MSKRQLAAAVSSTSEGECPIIDLDAVIGEEFGITLGDDAIVARGEESLLSRYLRCVEMTKLVPKEVVYKIRQLTKRPAH